MASYEEQSSNEGEGWIAWFCELEGHEFFVEVSEGKHLRKSAYPGMCFRLMKSILEIASICMDLDKE